MKNLIKFELRKIIANRLTCLSVIAVLLLSVILSFSTLQNMYSYDGESNEGNGKKAVEIDKSIAAKYAGILTDEKVQQIMADFEPTHDLHGMNAKYLYRNSIQSAAFVRFSDMDGHWNGTSVSDVFGEERIEVGYVNGWLNTSQNMAKVFITLSLVIILMISPVFSGEYNGVDNIILASRYGKTKCATAKVIASLVSAFLISILAFTVHLLFALIIYGTEGLDCSILFSPQEFVEGYIPFNITCGTVLKYQLLLALTGAIGVTGVALIISSICKNQMIAFAVTAALHVLPVFLPISEASALYRLIVLLPLYHSQYISILSAQQMQNGMLYGIWAIPMSAALAALGFLISRRSFAKHQVS